MTENIMGGIEELIGAEGRSKFELSAEEARQRTLANRAIDAEYFRLIREGQFEEAQELLDTELEGGG